MQPPKYNLSTPVIFRMVDGECTALFPTLQGDSDNPYTCFAWRLGGRQENVPINVGLRARLAERAEYMPLKKELQRVGYRLRVVARIAAAHNQQRRMHHA